MDIFIIEGLPNWSADWIFNIKLLNVYQRGALSPLVAVGMMMILLLKKKCGRGGQGRGRGLGFDDKGG